MTKTVPLLEKLGETRYRAACEALEAHQVWMADVLQRGLAEAREQPPEFWENRAARLVDDKLSGAARIMRRIAALPSSRPDWAEIVLGLFCELQVLGEAFRRLPLLPEPLQHEVMTRLVRPQQKQDLAEEPGVVDDWVALGSRRREEDHLITDATWFYGRETLRFALELNFTPQQQYDRAPDPWPCGGCFRREAVFYRGATPQRVFWRDEPEASRAAVFLPDPAQTFAEVCDRLSQLLAENPLMITIPVFIRQVRVLGDPRQPNGLRLRDQDDTELAVDPELSAPWRLLAAAGGHPCTLFGEWNGLHFTPLSVITHKRLVNLDPQVL